MPQTYPARPNDGRDWPNLADGETQTVRVFRDDPTWDAHEKWWMVPTHLANALYVCAYECDDFRQVAWIEKQHPGCVLVY